MSGRNWKAAILRIARLSDLETLSFVFTISFMLLGPLKLIPGFLKLTREADRSFKRELATKGSLIASATVAFAALAGREVSDRFGISIDADRLAGGLVLLISALNILFPRPELASTEPKKPSALQLALSPLAMPMIVPPAGIAAILIFVMLAPNNPGMEFAIAIVLAAVMLLDFLVMFFIDYVGRIPGLPLLLQVVGAVLVFIQVALAVETLMAGFRGLR
jgi:multiple antibiotic resistance protein